MNVTSLRITPNPKQLFSRRTSPAGLELLVVGWACDAPAIDSGVPEIAGRILSRALTREYSLTFIDPDQTKSKQWQRTPDGWLLYVEPTGLGSRLSSRGVSLRCASDAEAAARLFDTRYSLWDSERQVVLLASPENTPPRLTYKDVEGVFQPDRLDWKRFFEKTGGAGVMIPGPDGDFACLYFGDRLAANSMAARLEEEARAAGAGFESVSETEFQQTKWFLQEVGG